MENELFSLQKTAIGSKEINAVNARELWEFMEINTRFNDWIKNSIKDFNFQENQDFTTFTENLVKVQMGRPSKEYMISISMAKELSMLCRNAKGKEARLYFIRCEENLRKITGPQRKLPTNFIESLEMLVESEKQKLLLETKIEKDKSKVEFAEAIESTENAISIGEFAKLLKEEDVKMGPNQLFAWLRNNKYLMSGWKKRNIPYQRFIDSGYFQVVETTYVNNGVDYLTTKTLVTGKGQVAIIQKIKEI